MKETWLFPTHRVNVIEMQRNKKSGNPPFLHQPPPLSGLSPLSSKKCGKSINDFTTFGAFSISFFSVYFLCWLADLLHFVFVTYYKLASKNRKQENVCFSLCSLCSYLCFSITFLALYYFFSLVLVFKWVFSCWT